MLASRSLCNPCISAHVYCTCVDSLTSMPPLTQDYIWGEAVQMLSEVGQVVVNVWPLENLLHLFLNSQQT